MGAVGASGPGHLHGRGRACTVQRSQTPTLAEITSLEEVSGPHPSPLAPSPAGKDVLRT